MDGQGMRTIGELLAELQAKSGTGITVYRISNLMRDPNGHPMVAVNPAKASIGVQPEERDTLVDAGGTYDDNKLYP